MPDDRPDLLMSLLPPAIGGLLALLALWGAMGARRRQRMIADLPTSKTQGVFIGLVELKGTAETRRPLTSALAETRCVYYTWGVEEHWSREVTETYTDSEGKTQTRTRTDSGWETVASGGEMIPFYLQDDTGAVRVVPDGAKIEPVRMFDQTCGRGDPLYYGKGPSGSVSNSDYRRRFHEDAIPAGAELYIVGHAREREDVVAPEIAQDQGTPMYLISMRTEKEVGSGLAWQSWGLAILGLFLALGGMVVRAVLVPRTSPGSGDFPAVELVVAGAIFLVVWILSWIWMAYNSLVDLRNRVAQAWSVVDVELKRRHDLIPSLVACVQGFRDHETRVQTEVASLRGQLSATPPGEPGPDPQAVLPAVRAIAERYPELKAQESFLKLQEGLTETEQRIALARAYFNEIATFYNTRLEVVPDRFLAAMGTFKPRTLMAAADFERAPVTVDFGQSAPNK